MTDQALIGAAAGGFRSRMRALFQAAGDLLWPPVCAICPRCLTLAGHHDDPSAHFCPECLEELEFMPSSQCPVCGRPFFHSESHLCGDCLAAPPAYHSARSALIYSGAAARSIIRLKYYGEITQVRTLSALAAKPLLIARETAPDLIVPMPISLRRRAERGFNQAEELARTLYRPWRRLIDGDVLTRPADGDLHQAALPSAEERRKAIRGCFKVPVPEKVRGAAVLLFDDVLTTGATAGEAARTLLKAGAARVEVATIARSVLTCWR